MRDVTIRKPIRPAAPPTQEGVLGAAAALLAAFHRVDSGRADSADVAPLRLAAFDAEPTPAAALRGIGLRPIVDNALDAAVRATRDALAHAVRPPESIARVLILSADLNAAEFATAVFGRHTSKLEVERLASTPTANALLAQLASIRADAPRTMVLAVDPTGATAFVTEPIP